MAQPIDHWLDFTKRHETLIKFIIIIIIIITIVIIIIIIIIIMKV